jgi:hypothetical protein
VLAGDPPEHLGTVLIEEHGKLLHCPATHLHWVVGPTYRPRDRDARSSFAPQSCDNRPVPTERPHPPADAPNPPRVHLTPEDLERFSDEEQARTAWDEGRLRDEQPPHHR